MNNYTEVMQTLVKVFPEPAASEKATPWECLLFTALTARSRDDQVEPVFRQLMRTYPTVPDLAKANVADVEKMISTIGLYRSKARAAVGMANMLVEKFNSTVPHTLEELITLPGVGRKTASCVLVYSFGIPAIAVDTHVHRVVNRLGWVKTTSPESTEKALRAALPEKYWLDINRVMVSFGRAVCAPGTPRCPECPIKEWCKYPKKTIQKV
jgi:endonuclease-3